MIRRGQPAFMVGVRGMVYLHLRVRTGATDMHSGMFGAAALNATHALMAALDARPSAARTVGFRDELRVGVDATDAEELEAWAQLPSGAEQLAQQGASPIAPGAADEFYVRTFADTSLDVNGIASGSPDLVKTVLPVEARANVSMRLAPGQDPETIRAAFERLVREALPDGAELEITLRQQRASGAHADGLATRSGSPATPSSTSSARARSSCARAARSRSTRASSSAGCRRSRRDSASRASATCTRRTRTSPRTPSSVGVATMREVFARLGELGA